MSLDLAAGPGAAGWRTATLSETRRNCAGVAESAWVRASKTPVAVFLIRAGTITAYDPGGRRLDLAALEELRPGLRAELDRLG